MEDENCSFLALLMAPDESPIENPYEIQSPPPNVYQEFEPDYISINQINQTPPQDENYFFPTPIPVQVSEFNNLNPVYEFDNFSILPSLLSLETRFPESSPSPFKFPKLEPSHPFSPPPPPPPPQVDDYSLGSILKECTKKAIKNERPPPATTTTAKKTKRARTRDSMYELSKLMPAGYGKKKTMAEMLESACKYVKFLQAQVNALECMPAVSRLGEDGDGGRLRRLTRQQLLQVAVNSEEMQVVMADNGLCLVSEEQMVQFRKVEMRNKIVQQLLAHIPI